MQSFHRFHIAALSDGVAPKLLGGAAVTTTAFFPHQTKLVLHFDEALDTSSVPAIGDFTVESLGLSALTVSAVSVDGRSVVLTIQARVATADVLEVTWTPGTNRIRDLAGNAAAGFRLTIRGETNGAPAFVSAMAAGAKVVLTYDKLVDPVDTPAASAFTLHLPLFAGDRVEFNHDVVSVAVAGRTVVLQLADVVYPCAGDIPITVSYAVPTSSPLQGLDGTDAAALTNEDVSNGHTYRCNNYNWLEGARVGSVILRAQRPLATDVAPEASWFTVTASGGPVTVTAAAYSADDAQELKLSLSRDLEPGETVTVSYIPPAGRVRAVGHRRQAAREHRGHAGGEPGGGGGAHGRIQRRAGRARRPGQRVQLRAGVQRELRGAARLQGAAGRGAAGDQRPGDGRRARDAGSEPALDDHGSAAVERRRDRDAAGDGELLGRGRDMRGRQEALEHDLGNGPPSRPTT